MGRIKEEMLLELCEKENISFVALTHVNSQSGVAQPIEPLCERIKKVRKNIAVK